MKIHILGIAGKLMSGLAMMAQQLGMTVSGSDANLNSPMAKQLKDHNITLFEGYLPEHLDHQPDCVIVGNVMSRGNPLVEALLNRNIPFVSAPEWLAKVALKDKWVIAVSGTHGKTTTTSMVAWILEHAGLHPGFLIGGQPNNFDVTSRLTDSPFFVIEADEYDSAFFDKRPKFIHYHPRTLIINNLEFDHADIYRDLDAIQQQFHYLVRTVPGEGMIIAPASDAPVQAMLDRGCWSGLQRFGATGDWAYRPMSTDFSTFEVMHEGKPVGVIRWSLLGQHNANNALAAVAAAHHVGVHPGEAIAALCAFAGVERRMQPLGELNGARVFDDFAHHPTAVKTTLTGLRENVGGKARIVVILEFGSYTMKSGVHQDQFVQALDDADYVYLYSNNCTWDINALANKLSVGHEVFSGLTELPGKLAEQLSPGDNLVIMTNQDSLAISRAIGL